VSTFCFAVVAVMAAPAVLEAAFTIILLVAETLKAEKI
jgi:hypothetical protein